MRKRTVAPVVLDRDERLQGVARRGEERQIALGGPRAAGGFGVVLVDGVAHDEVEGAGGREIAELDEVRPLEAVETLDELGNQEVKIGVTLAVAWLRRFTGRPSMKRATSGPSSASDP